MAIAGSTVPAKKLTVINGRLSDGGNHRPLAHLACDAQKAIVRLRAGESIYLKLLGDNWEIVKSAFQPEANR